MSRRGERGSGSLLAGIGLWALALLVLVLLGAASFALGGHKVAGAADLAAVAGAQAQVGGADACGAARSSAAARMAASSPWCSRAGISRARAGSRPMKSRLSGEANRHCGQTVTEMML